MHPIPPAVLVFAASDPSGGAGIQADLLTLASLGCYPLTAITALTVQDTCGIQSVHAVEARLLEQQARSLLADIPITAFKLGALGSVDNIVRIAKIVSDYPGLPLVLDPVLASGRGDALADREMISALCELLLPKTTILTPNLPEARRLAATGEEGQTEIASCARRLLDLGARHVLVTGTHDDTPEVVNTLYGASGILRSNHWQRLPGSYHGSGCTLASAIAAFLARGIPVEEAVFQAQEYTWNALSHAFRPGKGQSIPDRLYRQPKVE